jgi:hypothetical protein
MVRGFWRARQAQLRNFPWLEGQRHLVRIDVLGRRLGGGPSGFSLVIIPFGNLDPGFAENLLEEGNGRRCGVYENEMRTSSLSAGVALGILFWNGELRFAKPLENLPEKGDGRKRGVHEREVRTSTVSTGVALGILFWNFELRFAKPFENLPEKGDGRKRGVYEGGVELRLGRKWTAGGHLLHLRSAFWITTGHDGK